MSHLVLTVVFTILLFPAIFMVLIPMMPAMTYLFGMAAVYGLVDRFEHLQLGELAVLAGIFCISLIVDWFAGVLGAKYFGASKKSILWGCLGILFGSILFPPFGGIPGLFLAVFISELLLNKSNAAAWKAAAGSLVGALSGVAINLILAVTFFVLFIIFSF
ncbi:MAG: DUF456 domain-containing protein [Patescibacteria group bacterium]